MEQREEPKAAPETSNRDLIADVRERCTGQSLQEKAYIHGSDVHSNGLVVPGMPGWSPNFNKISEPQQSAADASAHPETTQTGLARQEKILEETFVATVPSIDIRSVVVAVEGRNMPKSLGEYRFIPLVRNPELRRNPGSLYDDRSLSYTARYYNLPDGVRATCDKTRPYLDTGFAIGLVRGDWLIAVAGAGLTDEGQLKIIQLQDVTGDEGKNTPENPKGQFKTGLHDGFLWRNTLVEAWNELARRSGVADEIIVQSAANSTYDRIQKPIKTGDGTTIPQGYEGYDTVADQQGFIPQPETGDWIKKLTNTVAAMPHRKSGS
jgi:hypothetical protein